MWLNIAGLFSVLFFEVQVNYSLIHSETPRTHVHTRISTDAFGYMCIRLTVTCICALTHTHIHEPLTTYTV